MKAKKPRPERDQTDESLRSERKNTDQAIAARQLSEDNADEVVERAREQADVVLDVARDKADLEREATGEVDTGVDRERAKADQLLQRERDAADETLRREREELTRTLAALLPLERASTDRFLLTERARSDDAIANRDDFLGMVSHDLRNLLSGIVLNASVLADAAPDTDEGRRTVSSTGRIQRYVARMNRLIGDLVDVVSIDAGKLAMRKEPFDVAAVITEAVDAFSQAAAEKEIALKDETRDRPLVGHFDHGRLLQVLANLITNALKFTPKGGAIVIVGERVDDELRIHVKDNGAGIPDSMLEAVFERFWQVGKNDKRGLGLGLYISRCIVDAHGGKIWAESVLNEGSVFHVTLPAAA